MIVESSYFDFASIPVVVAIPEKTLIDSLLSPLPGTGAPSLKDKPTISYKNFMRFLSTFHGTFVESRNFCPIKPEPSVNQTALKKLRDFGG
jgi:hypothetical protein